MATAGSRVLSKMLDRLLAGLMSGPNMNCRPHKSRQRVDLTQLARLQDTRVEDLFRDVLGAERCGKAVARVKLPRKLSRAKPSPEESADDAEKSPGEKAWTEQAAILNKLRVIADDARTYENDTGVHALSIGFPLLSLPPGTFGGGASRPGTKRILAPIAFIPVTLTLKGGASPGVEIACHSGGADRVRANPALLSWLEQQTGKAIGAELFEDEPGTDPWREITQLVERVAAAAGVEVPELFKAVPISKDDHDQTASLSTEAEAPPGTGTAAPAEQSTASVEAMPTPSAAEKPPLQEIPTSLSLQATPRGDEDDEQSSILPSAVLGLFPTAHQGLVRDTKAMIAESSAGADFAGPIRSFLTTGIDFDAVAATQSPLTVVATQSSLRPQATERLAAAADPCQAKAVALARESAALVVHGPPGTGKSQTITNIVADHLSRGQRVLLVCDKRTALDVVADRLEHMGLGSFCGIVHDPQRDQRDLYRAIRQQLDDLPDAKTHPRAEASLASVDAELQKLHDELTGFHVSLMDKPADGGPSFHELMGQWMSTPADPSVKFDDALTQNVAVTEFESQRASLMDLLRRAATVKFSINPWAECAGVNLTDFLARPMSDVRKRMDRIVVAAGKADAAADTDVPSFNDKAAITEQATARTTLSNRLDELLPAARPLKLTDLKAKTAADHREALARVKKAEASIAAMKATQLDAELMVSPPLALDLIRQQAFELQTYLAVASGWTGFFKFKEKSAATAVLAAYRLPLTPGNAERVHKHLAGLIPRLALAGLREVELGTLPATGILTIPPDHEIEQFFSTVADWSELVLRIYEAPASAGLIDTAVEALEDEERTRVFIDGLRKSAARAEAVVGLQDELSESDLFAAEWLAELDADLRRGKLAEETVEHLREQLETLEGVLRVRSGRASVPASLGPAVDEVLGQLVDPTAAMTTLSRSITAGEITRRLRVDSKLHEIDAHRVESAFERFRELDSQKKMLVREVVAHRWVSKQKYRLLALTGTKLNGLGSALRQRLLMRGERAKRLRQVIAIGETIEGGDPLFDLCPVWMASPETVAQIFPRKAMFDVVIFDEASQCRLEEALPVLIRGHRVVIAGDPNQLPPTRFFESGVVQSQEDEPETEQELFESQQGEIEDLLAAALNLAIQQCYLDVHYRSRNADLIEFSNRNFYASRLQAIPGHPANRSKFSPLTLYRVDGIYDKRRNEAEADRVVGIVRDLLKRATPPSIGIACLNLPQRDLIVEKLDDRASEDADFAKRLSAARSRKGAGSFEGLFVKNLENVQGDERDDIIISTTYGPGADGKFFRRFGPLGMAGGGRRLNVLVTRARNEVHLVTSIPVESYRSLPAVPEGQVATGAWLLFAYLRYAELLTAAYANADAERASRAEAPSAAEFVPAGLLNVKASKTPSVFANQLAAALAGGRGLGSDVPWGNEGFCVDIAVHHPQRPRDVTIGVLCDGCRFPAADDPVEWDIFRTGMLRDQGWDLHRIWTPHYFRDPEAMTAVIAEKVRRFVEQEKPVDAIPTERRP